MANPIHLEILKKGVVEWNMWRKSDLSIKPDFRNANLQNIDLCNADLRSADLQSADLRGVALRKADLRSADLRKANLYRASLGYAILSRANLNNANLKNAFLRNVNIRNTFFNNADLRSADLRKADLNKSDFKKANLSKADLNFADLSFANFSFADLNSAHFGNSIFGYIDLKDCIGLDLTIHDGPSIIDLNNTKLDYDNLPLKFLKGCGLTDWQIEAAKLNAPDLTSNQVTDLVYEIDRLRNSSPIQLFNLFISYSREDNGFVECLEKHFDKRDIRYWRDVHDMLAGPVEKQIDKAIRLNETALLVLSETSVKSDWVEWEVKKARKLEKKLGRHVICPVAIDDVWKSAPWSEVLMDQVKKYNVLDFSDWKNSSTFEGQFAKLLKGLNIYYKK